MDPQTNASKPKLIPVNKTTRFQLPLKNLPNNSCSIPTPDPEIQEEHEQNTNSLTEKDLYQDRNINTSGDTSARYKETIIEELLVTRLTKQCPVHPEEDLEFFSFTKGRALCAECLVSGNYVGHEVINIKRASEKIKKQFKEIIQETQEKLGTYEKWERKAEGRKGQLIDVMEDYKQDIKKKFEELKRKIVEKENEIIEGIDQLKIEKEWEFEAFSDLVKKRQGEVLALQETLCGNIGGLDDVTLCTYYIKKEQFIRGFLKDTGNLEQKKVDGVLEKDYVNGGFNLERFEESFNVISGEVENMKGLEETKKIFKAFENEKNNNNHNLSQKTLNIFAEWERDARRNTPNDLNLKQDVMASLGPLARKGYSISINTTRNASRGKNEDIFGNYYDQIQKIRNRRNPSFSESGQGVLLSSSRLQGLSDKLTGASTTRVLNTERRGVIRGETGRILTDTSRSDYSNIKGHESHREHREYNYERRNNSPLKQTREEGFKNAKANGSYLTASKGNENVGSGIVTPTTTRTFSMRPESPVIKGLQSYISSSPMSSPNSLGEKIKGVIQRKGVNLEN